MVWIMKNEIWRGFRGRLIIMDSQKNISKPSPIRKKQKAEWLSAFIKKDLRQFNFIIHQFGKNISFIWFRGLGII